MQETPMVQAGATDAAEGWNERVSQRGRDAD